MRHCGSSGARSGAVLSCSTVIVKARPLKRCAITGLEPVALFACFHCPMTSRPASAGTAGSTMKEKRYQTSVPNSSLMSSASQSSARSSLSGSNGTPEFAHAGCATSIAKTMSLRGRTVASTARNAASSLCTSLNSFSGRRQTNQFRGESPPEEKSSRITCADAGLAMAMAMHAAEMSPATRCLMRRAPPPPSWGRTDSGEARARRGAAGHRAPASGARPHQTASHSHPPLRSGFRPSRLSPTRGRGRFGGSPRRHCPTPIAASAAARRDSAVSRTLS